MLIGSFGLFFTLFFLFLRFLPMIAMAEVKSIMPAPHGDQSHGRERSAAKSAAAAH
jgi:molybdopterin-containing oxidoreductase family membrane subunit